nr:MAG TPA: Exonuclease [Caudoviricetes sp.]
MKPRLILRADAPREEWLKVRTQGIGGSDCGTVLGLNPYKSAYSLAAEKIGMMEPDDLSGNAKVWFGTQLEPVVATRFEIVTGKKVHKRGTLQDPDHPYMLANIDRWVVGENAGLEIKTADYHMRDEWGDPDDPKDIRVPDSYYCQVLHYMAVTGADYWYIAALIGGNDFRVKRIERNEDDIAYIREKEKDFWDLVQAKKLPPLDASNSTASTLLKLHNYSNGEAIDLGPDALVAIQNYQACKRREKELKEGEQEAKNLLMAILGDNEVGTVTDGEGKVHKVTWKSQTRESISVAKLKKQDPASYEALKAIGLITTTSTRVMRI